MGGAEMKVLAATLISLSLFASAASLAQTGAAQADASPTASAQDSHSIKITRSGSQQPSKGPAEHFTGSVRIEPLFPAHDPSSPGEFGILSGNQALTRCAFGGTNVKLIGRGISFSVPDRTPKL
jgi:hypothetical protein